MGVVFSAFQRAKLERIIRANKKRYLVTRYKKNEYGESTSEMVKHFLVPGLFHDRQGFVPLSEKDGATIQRYTTPMLLILVDDFKLHPIMFDDVVRVNKSDYRVLDVRNLGEANFVYDLSMELIE